MSFIIIGELLNTTRERIRQAVADRDKSYIVSLAQEQIENGAHYIDVNAAARIGHESEDLQWMIDVIQSVGDVSLCIDSPSPEILGLGYEMARKPPIINSISLESGCFESMLEFLRGKECKIVALCMEGSGMVVDVEKIVSIAKRLVESLEDIGFQREDILVDPLVRPVSVDVNNAIMALECIKSIKATLTGVRTVCGLSNVSYGLPARRHLNRAFLSLALAAGLDTAVMDPTDTNLISALYGTRTLLGKDEYCMGYIDAYSSGKLT